jgi:hypothetical protein
MAVASFSQEGFNITKDGGTIDNPVDLPKGVNSKDCVVIVFLLGVRYSTQNKRTGQHALSFAIS